MKINSVRFILKTVVYQTIVFSILAITAVACGGNGDGPQITKADSVTEPGDNNDGNEATDFEKELGICSVLDFTGVSWPTDFTIDDRRAMALALNVTGSFEGHAGWTNLSNNFDGQGISMGLFNQNLGQGSLQPLLIKMRDNHSAVLDSVLTADMKSSMLGMLSAWERGAASQLSSQSLADVDMERYPLDKTIQLSEVGDVIDKSYGLLSSVRSINRESVNWAKKTVYKDSKHRVFKDEWATALRGIAGSPEYVSYQIEAATYLHTRAFGYLQRAGWIQLRGYLFLLDIAVQNGTLRDKHFDKFEKWLKKNPNATEEEQMLEMLAIRVVDSNPKWQKDVRIRKTAIIKGTGRVHGEDRNLPLEYCYDPLMTYPPEPAPNNNPS